MKVCHGSFPRISVLSLTQPNFLTGVMIETWFQALLLAMETQWIVNMKPYYPQSATHPPPSPLILPPSSSPLPLPHLIPPLLCDCFSLKTKLNCRCICAISISQIGSAYSLYSEYHTYKLLSDFKKEKADDPTSIPVDKKFLNGMFIFSWLLLHSVNHVRLGKLNGHAALYGIEG